MTPLIISVSGLRGIVGETLDPFIAASYAVSLAPHLGDGPIVLTRDGRATGRMLADTIRGALCGVGRDVLDADVAATPTTGRLVREHRAAGGIQISASHNPPPYNGIKLFGSDGRILSEELGEKVLTTYHKASRNWCSHTHVGKVHMIEDSTSDHMQAVLRVVDVAAIRTRQFAVLLDSNHGAGSVLGRPLLAALGCQATFVGDTPDGQFAHTPEPTADNLTGIAEQVGRSAVVVGFCQDPDADRLALIDENGRYVGEEYTLAVCLEHVLKSRHGSVVTNCSTSRMSEDIAKKHGVSLYRSRVGEANVADLMCEKDAVFGGEGNGGPIDPRVGYVRDSFVAMATVLDAMAATEKPLSQLVDELPRYAIHKSKVSMSRDDVDAAVARLISHFADATPDSLDGLRLDWADKWLLVRASNTEPIVRIIAEAPSEIEAKRLCDESAIVLGGS